LNWLSRFEKEFLRKPGEHLLEVGITGSGKTQGLYWICDGIVNVGKEAVVWFDIGKGNEITVLSRFRSLKIFYPYECKVEVRGVDDVKYHPFDLVDEIWLELDPSRINVVSIEPFIDDPEVYSRIVGTIFKRLVRLSHAGEIYTPLTVFLDEFHNVAPGKGQGMTDNHYRIGAYVQKNVERLRSLKVRIVASTHGITKIRKGVRTSFNWLMIRRISDKLGQEITRLDRYLDIFQTLANDEAIIVYPTKTYSDKIKLPFYAIPEGARVDYIGLVGEEEDREELKLSHMVKH
jgi:hypothetical protein